VGPIAFILWTVLRIFLAFMLVRLVVDWVQVFARTWTPRGPVLFILEIVYTVTDPPIRFIRRFIPPLRIGSVALDTSFLVVLIIVYLLQALVVQLPF
jgi:YggT family protein